MADIKIRVRTSQRVVEGSGRRITLEPDLPAFDRLELTGPLAVELTREGPARVEIDDNLADWLVSEVTAGRLIMRLRDPNDPKASIRYELEQPVRVTLPIAPLESAELHGGCTLHSTVPLTSPNFELETHGSGGAVLAIEADKVRVETHGSGRVELTGRTERLDAEVHGSGMLAAQALPASQCTARLSGSGTIEVAVTDELDARVSGRGVVRYHGTPRVRERVSGKGRIERA